MNIFKYAGGLLIMFIGVTGGLISEMEYIPDNAQIMVVEENKMWFPDAEFARETLMQMAKSVKDEDISLALTIADAANLGEKTTYEQVKKGNKYEGYKTLPIWESNENSVRRGWYGSLLLSWFAKKKRWNEDGSWNY